MPTWKPRPGFWGAWLAAIVVSFAAPEALAIANGGTTFSAFMAGMQQSWHLWDLCWGLLIGGLSVHFWWHWKPPPQPQPRLAERKTTMFDSFKEKLHAALVAIDALENAPTIAAAVEASAKAAAAAQAVAQEAANHATQGEIGAEKAAADADRAAADASTAAGTAAA